MSDIYLVGSAFALASPSENEHEEIKLYEMKETSSGQNTIARYIGNTTTTTTTAAAAAAAAAAADPYPPPPTTKKNNNCDADHNKDF